MFKKTLIAVVAMCVCALFNLTAYAVTVTVGNNVPGNPGQVVSVPVSLDDVTGQGIIANDLTIRYNPAVLTLQDVEGGSLTSSWMTDGRLRPPEMPSFTFPLMYNVTSAGTQAEAKIAIYGAEPPLSGAGDIAHLVFNINPTAPTSVTNISLIRGELNEIPATLLNSGSINITGTIIVGDVNGDGNVNVGDIIAIVNILMGAPTRPGADVNGDGFVNVGDIIAIVNIFLTP